MTTKEPNWTDQKWDQFASDLQGKISELTHAEQLAWCVEMVACLVPVMAQLREGHSVARDSDARAIDLAINVAERQRISTAAFSSRIEQLEQKP